MGLDITLTTKKHEIDFRKHNHIFRFVESRIDGEIENCKNYKLKKSEIEELLNRVNTVLDDHSKAEELLPTQGGFFFGNTVYNDDYFEDLEYAKRELTAMLADWVGCEKATFWAWW